MREHRLLDDGTPDDAATYRFALDGHRWPVVVGRTEGGLEMTLTRQVP